MASLMPDTKFNAREQYRYAFDRAHWMGNEFAWRVSCYGYLFLPDPVSHFPLIGKSQMRLSLEVPNQRILDRMTVPEILGDIAVEADGLNWGIMYQFSGPVEEEREVSLAIQWLAHNLAVRFHEAYEALDAADDWQKQPVQSFRDLTDTDMALGDLIDESGFIDFDYTDDDPTIRELLDREWRNQGF